jgi:hypothetical protein
MEKVRDMVLVVIATIALIYGNAFANVTMDVDKWNGASGTYQCKDAHTCYMLYYAAEERGDTYYCNSVVMKRGGKVIWSKNFWVGGVFR